MVVIGSLAGVAHADPSEEITARLDGLADFDRALPRFAFTGYEVYWDGSPGALPDPGFHASRVAITNKVIAFSSDGTVAWFAADVKANPKPDECTPACKPSKEPPKHTTGVLEKGPKVWAFTAWHIAPPVTAKLEAAYRRGNVKLDEIARSVTGAEDVAALFESSIQDPKALIDSVSDRSDVVLYGSEAAERTVGGAKVKARLAAWKLSFKVKDGVRAGLTANKTVAYVAANVDATSLKKPKDKPLPYRLLAIYEKTGTQWKLVSAQFSVDTFTGD